MSAITWDEIEEGQELPVLDFPITWKTLMLIATGNRDLNPYHHHPEYAKALGLRGPFVNTMFYQGLFARYATDFTGHLGDFRSTELTMRNAMVPGDNSQLSGRVARKWKENGEAFVELALEINFEGGQAVTSATVMAVPSAEFGDPKPARRDSFPAIPQSEGMPAAAVAELGKQVSRVAPYPVSEVQIMYFCEMSRDANPLYIDSPEARGGRYGGIIAPPPSLITWTMAKATQVGIDPDHPDIDAPQQDAWPAPEYAKTAGFWMPGVTDVIVQKVRQEYGTPPRPGDVITTTAELMDCSPLKQTRLGPGYFVSSQETYRNQRGEIVGRTVFTMLQYGVRDEELAAAE